MSGPRVAAALVGASAGVGALALIVRSFVVNGVTAGAVEGLVFLVLVAVALLVAHRAAKSG